MVETEPSKRQVMARKSINELLALWDRRGQFPPDTRAALKAVLSERGIAGDALPSDVVSAGGKASGLGTNGDFRDLTSLSVFVKAGLWAGIAVTAIGLWSGWLEIDLLQRVADGATVSEADAAASDSRQALVGGLQLLVFVITGIAFLRWIYFANYNTGSFGATGMQFTPGWAVGWYFVPVATLWKPYQALKEVFKASHPDFLDDWQHAPHPRILPLWWTLWVISNFIGQAVFRLALGAETIDEILAASWITFVADAVGLPLGFVAMNVVARLQLLQSEKHRRSLG